MKDIPFVAFGNDKIDQCQKLGKTIKCGMCDKQHKVQYGERILEDGSKVPDKIAAFYRCEGTSYLCGINGQDIRKAKGW